MRRSGYRATLVALALLSLPGLATSRAQGDAPAEPLDSGQIEEVRVDLVLVEAMVLDRQGRTVPGLAREDFVLVVSGREMRIDVFGATCGAKPGERVAVGSPAGDERPGAVAPDMSRRTVLLFDYYHLGPLDRGLVLEEAQRTLREHAGEGEEILVAALANGLRIEQDFTPDLDAVASVLDRMEHDVTLWAGSFEPLTERAFFDGLATLMDVLAGHAGAKAVLLYSNFLGPSRSYDRWYWDVAQRAATSRTVIYPVFAKGLEDPLSATAPLGGSSGLTRLANESGGRFLRNTNDLARAYSAAREDMACRYTLGFYVDPEWARNPKTIRIRVHRRGLSVRAPEVFKAWTEEERRESALRAAFSQPDRYRDPLVRAHVFPMRPISRGMWSALAVLQLPLRDAEDETVRTIDAVLTRNGEVQGTLRREIKPPPASERDHRERAVTLYGEARVLPGENELTVALSEPEEPRPRTTQVVFDVPEVPAGRPFVRGPVLARDRGAGLLLQDPVRLRRRSVIPERSVLGQLLGPRAGLEPLLVQRVRAGEALALLWEACGVDLERLQDAITVERRWVDDDGTVVHRMEPLEVAMTGRRVRCAGTIESIEPGTVPPGSYRLEVEVRGEGAEPSEPASIPVRVEP